MNSILYCPGEERIFVTVFAGVDGIVCFAIEMSSATQNWLKMTNEPLMDLWNIVSYLFVRLILSGSRFNLPIISDIRTSLFYCFIINVTKARLWTISVLVWGSHTDDEYSRSGRT